jgi:Na+/proline symporter
VVGGGVGVAYWLPNVVEGLEIFWKITPMMGIAFWLGLFWRRTTVKGAWAATVTAFGVWWLTTQGFFISFADSLPASESLRFVTHGAEGSEIYLPWQMVFYLASGTLAGIAVSLFTRPVAREKLDNFYALIRTPIQEGEKIETPCTLPGGVPVPEAQRLLPRMGLEILVPSRLSVYGFCAGVLCAAAMVACLYLLI